MDQNMPIDSLSLGWQLVKMPSPRVEALCIDYGIIVEQNMQAKPEMVNCDDERLHN